MFNAIAQFFMMFATIFGSINRLANAGDALAETAEQRAQAFRDEQQLENNQRLERIKAKAVHLKENPTQFEF